MEGTEETIALSSVSLPETRVIEFWTMASSSRVEYMSQPYNSTYLCKTRELPMCSLPYWGKDMIAMDALTSIIFVTLVRRRSTLNHQVNGVSSLKSSARNVLNTEAHVES